MHSHSLWYRQSAKNFNEALPLGNGRIGAMIYGGGIEETVTLNEDTLWSGYPRRSQLQVSHVWEKVKELVSNQQYQQAACLLEQEFSDFNVQAYLPLGTLRIRMEGLQTADDLTRTLRLDTACHETAFSSGLHLYKQTCFVSHPHQVLAMRISEAEGHPVCLTVTLEGALQSTVSGDENSLYLAGNCPIRLEPTPYTEKNYMYDQDDARKGIGYLAGVRAVSTGGVITCSDSTLSVQGASEVFLYFAVRTSFNGPFCHPVLDGKEYIGPCMDDLCTAADIGYNALLQAHLESHKALYDRCCLNLGETSVSQLPTDVRLSHHAQGEKDPALYALLFHYGRYLMISASRPGTQATNLQGIWNDKLVPPWSSNYTLNINTEMNYWPAAPANLAECAQPLLELIRQLRISGQTTAENYYHAPGFCGHHNSDLWRSTHPVSSKHKYSCQWSQWPMSTGWLCCMAYDLYRYNRDDAYLKELLPILEECTAFYTTLLTQRDGYFLLFPSTSPENNYLLDGERCPLDDTTTMSMAILRDVLDCTAQAREHLGLDSSPLRKLEQQLLPYRINSDGTLNEWYTEHEDWEVHHRHVSHLYGLYPSHQIGSHTPALMDACRATLEKRGDESTGWSLAWKINLWARLRDGDRALRLLDLALAPVASTIDYVSTAGGSYPNLFCAHPPFQIDGNFGACAGILEMLVQIDADGKPVLLPALPKEWHEGCLTGMRIPGNRTISLSWKNGEACKVSIQHN